MSTVAGVRHRIREPLIVFACVVVGSLVGLATRPVGLLSSFWPANAVLAGLLLRNPRLVRWWTAPVAAAGFVSADLVAGDPLVVNLWLAAANLVSAGAAYAVLRALPLIDRQLRRPRAVIHVVVAALAGGLTSATVCAWALSGPFGQSIPATWIGFLSGETANHLALLPVVLTFSLPARKRASTTEPGHPHQLRSWVAVAGLLVGAHAVAMVLEGPGANAYPLPALLAAAMVLGLAPTAVASLLSTAWTMVAIGHGWMTMGSQLLSAEMLMSLQIGTSLMVLGPIAVASAMEVRDEAFLQLRRRIAVDELTGALTRAAFHTEAGSVIDEHLRLAKPATLLMLDLDHFKRVNDTYGHLAGDEVLGGFGRVVRQTVRNADLFGRLGGEEFAILLPETTGTTARAIASRLRAEVAATMFDRLGGAGVTVSIGFAELGGRHRSLADLMVDTDLALYRAKSSGRDRVQPADPVGADPVVGDPVVGDPVALGGDDAGPIDSRSADNGRRTIDGRGNGAGRSDHHGEPPHDQHHQ